MTVSVPYFSDPANGGETLVTFTNKVQRVQVKICKLIEPGSETPIGGQEYDFSGTIAGIGVSQTFSGSVTPPYPGATSCTGLLTNAPIVGTDGKPTTINVTETSPGSVPFHITHASAVDNTAPVPPAVQAGSGSPRAGTASAGSRVRASTS